MFQIKEHFKRTLNNQYYYFIHHLHFVYSSPNVNEKEPTKGERQSRTGNMCVSVHFRQLLVYCKWKTFYSRNGGHLMLQSDVITKTIKRMHKFVDVSAGKLEILLKSIIYQCYCNQCQVFHSINGILIDIRRFSKATKSCFGLRFNYGTKQLHTK